MRLSLFPPGTAADAYRIVAARSLRSFADGFAAVLVPVYLLRLGFSGVAIGTIATAMLLGSALTTLAVGAYAARWPRRAVLAAASVLMAASGPAFGWNEEYWPLLLVAFFGTISASGGDSILFQPAEQTVLARSVPEAGRTDLFSVYSLAGQAAGALGSLAVAVPELIGPAFGWSEHAALRAMFVLYGACGVAALWLYRGISAADGQARRDSRPLGASRGIVIRMSALFCVDSFGGGFVVQAMLAFWLFERFDLPLTAAGQIFFWTGVLASLSYLAAPPLARRIGLVNTMVFTHAPANLCLMAVPFVSSLPVVLALLFVRAALSQMDVPTRTSYVMAVVPPEERSAAASLTVAPRTVAAALSPPLTGYLLEIASFAWPLLLGGAIKLAYDFAFLAAFRRLKPPEEMPPADRR